MPMVPSASSTIIQRPVPGTRPNTSRSSAAPGRPGDADGVRRDVDAERGHAALGQRDGEPPGPDPTSSVGPLHRSMSEASPGRAAASRRPQRRDAPVRVLDLGLRGWPGPSAGACPRSTPITQSSPSEETLVRYANQCQPGPSDRWPDRQPSPFRHRPYGVVTISSCLPTVSSLAELPCTGEQ